jgi:hypothetical protein
MDNSQNCNIFIYCCRKPVDLSPGFLSLQLHAETVPQTRFKPSFGFNPTMGLYRVRKAPLNKPHNHGFAHHS